MAGQWVTSTSLAILTTRLSPYPGRVATTPGRRPNWAVSRRVFAVWHTNRRARGSSPESPGRRQQSRVKRTPQGPTIHEVIETYVSSHCSVNLSTRMLLHRNSSLNGVGFIVSLLYIPALGGRGSHEPSTPRSVPSLMSRESGVPQQ